MWTFTKIIIIFNAYDSCRRNPKNNTAFLYFYFCSIHLFDLLFMFLFYFPSFFLWFFSPSFSLSPWTTCFCHHRVHLNPKRKEETRREKLSREVCVWMEYWRRRIEFPQAPVFKAQLWEKAGISVQDKHECAFQSAALNISHIFLVLRRGLCSVSLLSLFPIYHLVYQCRGVCESCHQSSLSLCGSNWPTPSYCTCVAAVGTTMAFDWRLP